MSRIRPTCVVIPGNEEVTIIYTLSNKYGNLTFNIFRSQGPDWEYALVAAGLPGNSGSYINAVTNNVTYYYRIMAIAPSGEFTDYSVPVEATPKADVTAPVGSVVINYGDPSALHRDVILDIYTIPDVVEMRISNNSRFEGAEWQSIATLTGISTTLDGDGVQYIYIQFRDLHGNIGGSENSIHTFDAILVGSVSTTSPSGPTSEGGFRLEEVILFFAGGVGVGVIVGVCIFSRRR